jgi:hypothetical protein
MNINRLFFSFFNLWLLLWVAVFISGSRGCSQVASPREEAEAYIKLGYSLEKLISMSDYTFIHKASVLPSGHITYTDNTYKGCTTIWEVNPSGIIVGYKLLGKHCD